MSAVISSCKGYRYRLERDIGPISIPAITAAVIMVNPSTADAVEDDHTIGKLRGFGERNGWSRIIVGNLFAYRAKDIRELATAVDPIGPENDRHLAEIVAQADDVIVAWGTLSKLPSRLRNRWRDVLRIITAADHTPMSLGDTLNDGHPWHPVMRGYDNAPQPWIDPETWRLMS